MFTPYQYQDTPRAVGRTLTTNHSRAAHQTLEHLRSAR
jgi:hypothetical protein